MAEQTPGPATILTQTLVELIGGVASVVGSSRARGRAKRAAREAERKARAQRRQWLEFVEGQKVRGKAGNANQEQAREALRGSGGRPNPLDSRRF